jgi:hypothetical protein
MASRISCRLAGKTGPPDFGRIGADYPVFHIDVWDQVTLVGVKLLNINQFYVTSCGWRMAIAMQR